MAHEAQSLSQLKSGFVSSVSHELRTPLTSIMGVLGLLKSGVEAPHSETAKSMLDIAYNNAERLLLLISDILDIEKIESGKMEFNFSEVNINSLIEDCIDNNNGLAEKYQVSFNFTKSDTTPYVSIDKDRIFQVMNNFMSNAAKFEPNGGVIEIATTLEDEKVRITIIDHGTGIPDEFHDRIFQAFTQADVSNTKGVAGTGLGLAISKTIIDHHNGEINFNSIPNESTCFYFTLPLATH
jgi:signal transduction histidine kinase